MSVKIKRGKTKFMYLPVTVSTAFVPDSLVSFTSGYLVPATSSSAAADIIGVIRHAITSADTDFATARLVEVQVPVERNTEWTMDVTSGLVAADVLKEVDLTDAVTVNRGASSVKAVRATGVTSGTQGTFLIKFSGSY